MSLVDILRRARASPISVLHEFKLLYDPSKSQVHAFVEGQADKAFYGTFIRKRLDSSTRLHLYDCHGKRPVYETQLKLKSDYPSARVLLFFVDKDLDELVQAYPDRECLFCTEVYSIENYLDDPIALQSWLEETFLLRDVRFDFAPLIEFYRSETLQFARNLLPLMGWVLAHRKAGSRPNLGDMDLGKLFCFDDVGQVRRKKIAGGRIKYLDKVTQVSTTIGILVETRRSIRVLSRIEASRWLRGKFFVWFLLQFLRNTERMVRSLAEENGGKLKCQTVAHDGNIVELLSSRIKEPRCVALFLDFWLPYIR